MREREGREPEPTAGIIDAQSVKAAAAAPAASRGYGGGKKVGGRKRHIVTDCLGLLLVVAVTAANIGDRDAAASLLMRLRRLRRDITLVWADSGYTGSLVDRCRQHRGGWPPPDGLTRRTAWKRPCPWPGPGRVGAQLRPAGTGSSAPPRMRRQPQRCGVRTER
ncbi:transposase [Streptomyces qaidamensis]|uniref:transposase n=1 Tax=Streptomyces qaidamensis TaxID=1783515 RepID=UPI0036E0FB27